MVRGEMSITLCGHKRGVTGENLDGPEWDASHDEMAAVGMPQAVKRAIEITALEIAGERPGEGVGRDRRQNHLTAI